MGEAPTGADEGEYMPLFQTNEHGGLCCDDWLMDYFLSDVPLPGLEDQPDPESPPDQTDPNV